MSAVRQVVLSLCIADAIRPTPAATPPDTSRSTPVLNAIIMGDWGGSPHHPYTTPQQIATAKAMSYQASKHRAAFVVALGDNFYNEGVTNASDPRWKATFEDVYTAPSLHVPWYVLAGNHDHYGDVYAQVAYSKLSTRWTFPRLYYNFSRELPGGTKVEFVMIDTVTIAGLVDDSPCERGNHTACLTAFPGPDDEQAADEQLAWIEATMAASEADHLIVAGHYPVYSVSEHGSTKLLVERLKPLLNRYNAHYMNGHDHTMEHIQPFGEFTAYYTTGAAHLCDYSKAHLNDIPPFSLKFHDCQHGGFSRLEVSEYGMTLHYYNGYGKLVYTAPIKAPRSKASQSTP